MGHKVIRVMYFSENEKNVVLLELSKLTGNLVSLLNNLATYGIRSNTDFGNNRNI